MLAIAPGWEMEVERGPACLLIRLKNPPTSACETPPLADELWSLLERHFVYRLVLDLEELNLLHSYLLGQLMVLDRRIRQHDGLLRLCNISQSNQKVLQVHGMHARLPSYHDVEHALLGTRRKPQVAQNAASPKPR